MLPIRAGKCIVSGEQRRRNRGMDFTKKDDDRRSKFRFAMERNVRYKVAEDGVVVAAGSGQTINMCSNGVAFVSEHPLTPGGLVELSISWPVLLGTSGCSRPCFRRGRRRSGSAHSRPVGPAAPRTSTLPSLQEEL